MDLLLPKKRRILRVLLPCMIIFLLVITPFFAVFLTGILTPQQFSMTYYGELSNMYSRLKNTQGKKVVIIGNSNVAFGVDSALMEQLINEAGLDYKVCNFGLYGALGTRMMLELSLDFIQKDDIVIFSPELSDQSLSMYFSAAEAWYSIDSNMEMFNHLSSSSKSALVGNFALYTSKKFAQYRSGQPAQPSGIYASASFDGRSDLKNYERPFNIMPNGADSNNPIMLNDKLFSEDFVKFVNDYAELIEKKNAAFYYSFAPMNVASMTDETLANTDNFYQAVLKFFNFPVISDIDDYILESEWFYDSNFHLNASGMTLRTVQLVNDLKNELGNTTKTDYALPSKPIIPDSGVTGNGDNSSASMFTYRLDNGYYTVTGLTPNGENAKELILPFQVDGIYIKTFLPTVFSNNQVVESVTVQENISTLSDNSFSNCKKLKKIILKHNDPAKISVGYNLLNNTSSSCKIYVPKAAVSRFKNNYFWGKYEARLEGY